MISLSRHIELLLLEHNCVIVPGLGGFIANIAPAIYNDGPEGDKLFMPPYRTIAFNPQLQVNDGLLVQSYMQAYDASYPAAYLQMEKEIEQLNTQLNLFGEVVLDGIGTLHKSLGHNIVLTSHEAGILTPSLYGTYSFGIKSLSEAVRERETQTAADQTNIMPIQTEIDLHLKQKEDEGKANAEKKIIPLKKRDKKHKNNYIAEIGIAAALAAIIVMVLLISNITGMNGHEEIVVAGAPYTNIQETKKAEPANHTKAGKAKQDTKSQTVKETVTEEVSSQSSTIEKKEQNTKDFTIVLASFVTEKNSNILIEKLASVGLCEAKFVVKGKTTRVIYSAYATEEEAHEALLSLREQNEVFKDAWTLKMN